MNIVFYEECPAILSIIDAALFTNVCSFVSSNDRTVLENGKIVIIDDNEELINILSSTKVYTDILMLDVNDKKNLNKIYQLIESNIIQDVDSNSSIQECIATINQIVLNYSLDLDLRLRS